MSDNIVEANRVLSYTFFGVNLFILISIIFILKTKSKNINYLKYKLLLLILLDSILMLFYIKVNNYIYLISIDIIYSFLYLFQFYLYISFIYNIIINSKISSDKINIELIQPSKLCLPFFLIIFPFNNYFYLYPEKINVIQVFIALSGVFLLYYYLKNIINNSIKEDNQNLKIYYYLNTLNDFSFILLLIYSFIKIISIFSNYNLYLITQIIMITINFGIKYFIFFLFLFIIYLSHEKDNKNIEEENIAILSKNNKSNAPNNIK